MKLHARTRPVALAGVSLAAMALAATPSPSLARPQAAVSQALENVFANPPAALPEAEPAPPRLSAPKGLVQAPPPKVQAADTFVDSRQNILYKFSIQFTEGTVRNPWTLSQDKVLLRSYHGSSIDPNTPFLAPTITMRPGQTVRISLANNLFETKDGKRLPAEKCKTPDGGVNVPHCFNDTNLHAHGLWVSPSGNSDNVLISINPGVTFEYEYNVPSDHPAGTFWYHPHKHGSTALQVSSGMDGALIIKDDRAPTATTPGDIDVLLQDAQGAAFPDKVLMFQQVQYACFDDAGKIQKSPNPKGQPWVCNTGQTGEIRDYEQQLSFSTSWASSGRFTSINGKVQPGIEGLRAGLFERWRLIHGGVREAVNFRLFPMKSGAPDWTKVPAAGQAEFMRKYCAGTALPMWEVALDGLTRSQVFRTSETRLQPGYRADVVVHFPTGGNYCIVDGASDALGSPSQAAEPIKLLGVAVVAPGAPAGDPDRALQKLMIDAAGRNIPDQRVAAVVVRDLNNGLALSKFVWHPTIAKEELNAPPQELAFNITADPKDPDRNLFQVNNPKLAPDESGSYVPSRIDRTANIGDVQEWRLTSTAGSHPFHIHVNPFQVVSVVNKFGKSVTDPGAPDFDPDYAGVIDQWKDTLFVKGGYNIVTRTRYQRYIGEYVLHCHILDHEDQGMMANVKIGIPDGLGGTAEAHGPGGGHGDHGM
jgi:FtsP/CotA-like multicopper oxidase with cupredoxin domain